MLMGAATAFIVLLVLVGLARQGIVTAILMFAIGFAGVLFMTTANTRLQLRVPGHMRGRVMAMYGLLFMGTTPLSSLLIGQLAERVGVQATILSMAGLCAVGVAAAALYARRTVLAAGGVGRMVPVFSADARQRVVDHNAGLEDDVGPA